ISASSATPTKWWLIASKDRASLDVMPDSFYTTHDVNRKPRRCANTPGHGRNLTRRPDMASVHEPEASPVRLAASDLTFSWEGCPRCLWLKARGLLKRPSGPFPRVFTRMDRQAKDYFHGK